MIRIMIILQPFLGKFKFLWQWFGNNFLNEFLFDLKFVNLINKNCNYWSLSLRATKNWTYINNKNNKMFLKPYFYLFETPFHVYTLWKVKLGRFKFIFLQRTNVCDPNITGRSSWRQPQCLLPLPQNVDVDVAVNVDVNLVVVSWSHGRGCYNCELCWSESSTAI